MTWGRAGERLDPAERDRRSRFPLGDGPVRGEDYGPGCGNDGCPCQRPGKPCGEWQGIDDETGTWCPRCGWSRRHHPAVANPRPASQLDGE